MSSAKRFAGDGGRPVEGNEAVSIRQLSDVVQGGVGGFRPGEAVTVRTGLGAGSPCRRYEIGEHVPDGSGFHAENAGVAGATRQVRGL